MMIGRIVALVLMGLVAAGCGGGAKAVPVSGVVTLDGKPLANAHVAFQPEATKGNQNPGVGSYGTTDASGKYTLQTFDNDKPGAVVGTHRVEISIKRAETDDRDPKTRPPLKDLPVKYNRNTELQFKVEPSGSTSANFDLKSQ